MADKGNKYGITKDDTRYGDMAQPKHENEWGYHEDQPAPSQGKAPEPAMAGGGMSWHARPPMSQEDHPAHNLPDATQSYDGDVLK